MFSPALGTLMRLRARGVLRRLRQSLQSVRGMAFALLALGMLVVWAMPAVMLPYLPREFQGFNLQHLNQIVPAMLLSACVVTILIGDDQPIRFHGAEIDFLFAAPFSRRELLRYKLCEEAGGALLAGAFYFIWLCPYVKLPLAALCGSFLAMWFVRLFQLAFLLMLQTLSTSAGQVFRFLAIGLMALAAGWLALEWRLYPPAADLSAWDAFQQASLGRVVLAPFSVYGRIMTAETYYPEMLGWSAAALAINFGLIFAILNLDAYYLEAALSGSRKFQQLLTRFRRGGALNVWATPFASAWRVPRFPHWNGIGSIAWRQLTSAARSLPTLLGVVGIGIFALVGPQLFFAQLTSRQGQLLAVAAGAAIVQLTILFIMLLRFDFRGDLDQMDWLKTLPLRPSAIVLGELATPVLIATVVQVLLLSGLAAMTPGIRTLLLLGAAFTLPLNVLLFGLENYLFLLYPAPVQAQSFNPGDIQRLGHQAVLFVGKMVALFACVLVTLLCGGAAFWLAGGSILAALGCAWLVLALQAAITIPLTARAFVQFDPSLDQPV